MSLKNRKIQNYDFSKIQIFTKIEIYKSNIVKN